MGSFVVIIVFIIHPSDCSRVQKWLKSLLRMFIFLEFSSREFLFKIFPRRPLKIFPCSNILNWKKNNWKAILLFFPSTWQSWSLPFILQFSSIVCFEKNMKIWKKFPLEEIVVGVKQSEPRLRMVFLPRKGYLSLKFNECSTWRIELLA